MNLWRAILSAIGLFRTQKVRFLLTVSGIVVGVASLVVLASLLEVGLEVLQKSSAAATGDDVLTVQNDWRVMRDTVDARLLDREDQRSIEDTELISAGSEVTAAYGLQDRAATFGSEDFRPLTIGVEPTAIEVYSLEVAQGRSFVSAEYDNASNVVVAGSNVLDGRLVPGDTVRVQGTPFRVVGVLVEKAEMGPGGHWSWNNRLLFPARTYHLQFDPSRRPTNIVVKVDVPEGYAGLVKDYVIGTRGVIDSILSRNRAKKTWEFEGASDGKGTEELIVMTIQALLYLTTLFSMIVGGINIMNIMLVTVAERTREIGVLRAIGASQRDILSQFLAETLAVTLLGAAFGLLTAVSLLGVASLALTQWLTEWPFRVVPWSVGLGVGVSVFIGLVFGLVPAWRASRLDPVEALRSD